MRPLNLHVSALNDAEYDLYIPSLNDLAAIDDDNDEQKRKHDDAYYEGLKVGVREARAWLRGRYGDVSVSDIDTILRFFHPNLGQTDCLTGGQFFAALRLVLHVEGGKTVDKGLAFVQVHPEPALSRPPSPPKRRLSQFPPPPNRPKSPAKRQSYQHPPVPAPPPPPPLPVPSGNRVTPPEDVPVFDTNPFNRLSSDGVPPITSESAPTNRNPFLNRTKSLNAGPPKLEGRTPPLPPRKPAQLIAPPRHAPVPAPTSGRPPPPPPASTIKTTHLITPLMRQSLQASKVGQSMKKAEEQLEQERVLQVLKSSSAERTRSISPAKHVPGGSTGTSSESEGPVVPRRWNPSPPPSSAGSLEEIASASVPRYAAQINQEPSSDLPAPPTHPDRRPSAQQQQTDPPDWPPSPAFPSARVFRSKSMHHHPPPIPPPRRRRPESVQLTTADTPPLASPQPPPHSATLLARNASVSSAPPGGADNGPSPMANLQRTLTSLQHRAQPRLDAARYKAEAGLSRRGFVQRAGRWGGEGEQGLILGRRGVSDGEDEHDRWYPSDDEEVVDADNLKWPTGEGWKQL